MDSVHQSKRDECDPILQRPVKFTLGWLDRVDVLIRQHLTQQGLLMKRGMATSRLYMMHDDTGMGLKSSVGVYLLELVRILLQYKWGTVFQSEWFWRMELTKRNGKGVWMRELENVLRRFGASLELLLERIRTRDDEIEALRQNGQTDEREKDISIRIKRAKSIADVLEEVEVLIDAHFNEFSETKSSLFLKKVLANQGSIDTNLFKKTWRTLNCTWSGQIFCPRTKYLST